MHSSRVTLTVAVLTLWFSCATVGTVNAGQEAIVRLDYLIKTAHLIAVIDIKEVTKVDVSTDRGQLSSVYVAQAVVEEHIKSDRRPTPRKRTIAIVGSTRPMSSAVWRPIRKGRYLAFLTAQQGHFHYGFNAAFRRIDGDNKVKWYEYIDGKSLPVFSSAPLKHAIERIGEVQKEIAEKNPATVSPSVAKTADRVLLRAHGLVDVSAEDHPERIQQVIRDVKSLADLLGVKDEDAAIDQVAEALNIVTIDFGRQMLVAVSAGPLHGRESLQYLNASSFSAVDNEVHVKWSIQRRMGRAKDPLVHPARFLLTTKFNGKVVILPPEESVR